MTPFYFVPLHDELSLANKRFDEGVAKGELKEVDRATYLFGWMQQCYQLLFEYMQEMQAEAVD